MSRAVMRIVMIVGLAIAIPLLIGLFLDRDFTVEKIGDDIEVGLSNLRRTLESPA